LPIGGTIAETYLRGRGITCDLPGTLRYHPSCWHASAKRLPALVALVEGADGFAVLRRWQSLMSGPHGSARKATIWRTLSCPVWASAMAGR